MNLREASTQDFDAIWPIFKSVAAAGDTYAYPRDICYDDALRQWMTVPIATYVLEIDGKILGTYYIKSNQTGPGDHVCNCGYMVADEARGKGLATTMCLHSQNVARSLGYKAMQFNFVASTNHSAVNLWNKLGFDTVGRLDRAFLHPTQGYVDALVMYKWLQ